MNLMFHYHNLEECTAADRSRKEVLVEYGFRLPSALDNRPLKFDEFIKKAPNYLFVSATPNELELRT